MTLEPVIVGGGIAGSAAAITLSRLGVRSLLLERSSGPHHKVCGEFLSGPALAGVRSLGVDPATLGGHSIYRVRLCAGKRSAEAPLPVPAMGISRYRLDEALLEQCARRGVRIERGARVGSVEMEDGRTCLDVDGAELRPATLLLATGKSEVRGASREGQRTGNDLVAFKMHLRLRPTAVASLAGTVELHIFDRGYAGLQFVEEGVANFCFLVGRDRVEAHRGSWDGLLHEILSLAPLLGERLAGGEPCFVKPLAVSGVPYGYSFRPGCEENSIFRLGDRFAVVHSLAGAGMAIAVESGRVAGEICGTPGGDSGTFHRRLSRRTGRTLRMAQLFYRMTATTSGRRLALAVAEPFPSLVTTLARLAQLRG